MNEDDFSFPDSYYDGVVCFGPATASELERRKKLPRHTILPSDIRSGQSFLSTEEDENNVNISMSTNNLEDEKETVSNNIPSVCSTPRVKEFIHSENLLATDVINRYIRMGSTSCNETLCSDSSIENTTKSPFNVTEMSSYGQLSISDIFKENLNTNQKNMSDVTNNVCILKHKSQQEDKDESIYSDSDCEDDSIITEKYSVTPKKRQLFDLRLVKSPRTKSFVIPVMDKIEETTNPVLLLNQDSSFKLNMGNCMNSVSNKNVPVIDINDYNNQEKSVGMEQIKSINTNFMEDMSDESYTNNYSTEHFSVDFDDSLNKTNRSENISSCTEHEFDIKKSMNITSNTTVPVINVNEYNIEKNLVSMDEAIEQINTSVIEDVSDETYINHTTDDLNVDFNDSLNKTNQSEDISNCIEHEFDMEKSMNITSNTTIPVIDVNEYNNEEKSVSMDIAIEQNNTSVIEDVSDETYINHSGDDFNDSLNKTNQSEDISSCAEHEFDMKKSVNIKSNITVPVIYVNDYNNEEKSGNMDVEIEQTNIGNKIDQPGGTSNITEQMFDMEKSLINMPTLTVFPIINNDTLQSCEIGNDGSKNITITNISYSEKIVSETCNTNLKDNLSSSGYDTELNISNDHSVETNENMSNNVIASNLSIIIENRTLEENEFEQDFRNPVSISSTSVSENILYESQGNKNFNKSTNLDERKLSNIINDASNYDIIDHHSTIDEVNNKVSTMEIKSNEMILINNIDSKLLLAKNENTVDSVSSDEKIKCNANCSVLTEIANTESIISSQVENHQLVIESSGQTLISHDAKKMLLSQHIVDKNNSTTHNFSAVEYIFESNNPLQNSIDVKHDVDVLHNVQQSNLLDITKSLNNNLNEKQMFNIERDKKEQMLAYKTPKIKKLLDLSILKQSPTFECQSRNQKLLNFSIVDQTPVTKNLQQTSLNENYIKKDTSNDFSSVDQIRDLDNVLTDKMIQNFEENNPDNLSLISAPDIELLADETIKTYLSNDSNSSCNETIRETNLNLSTNEANNLNAMEEIHDIDSSSVVMINKQIEIEKSNFLNKTVDQVEYSEPINMIELKQSNYGNYKNYFVSTEKTKCESKCSNTVLNLKNHTIMDFSIIEQTSLQNSEFKNNESIPIVEHDCNVSNLIEMSVISTNNINSNKQVFGPTENPVAIITSENESEELISNSDDINNTTVLFEQSTYSHENKILTDMQLSDVSHRMELSDKSSISESFHSIELEHVNDNNKRNVENIQECHSKEKKIKLVNEEPRTPMSMLYKIKSLFNNSEKIPVHKTNENELKLNKSYQNLNICKLEENDANFKKPEALIKSKIPCKVNDKSMLKNDELNNSSFSLNDSLKTKKAIPKFIGYSSVLSDVSNSSNKKYLESRIPSKFQK